MLVCHCKRVSDRAIRRAVRQGAVSSSAIVRSCQAGAGCGGCHSAIEDILYEEHATTTVEILSPRDYATAS